VIPYGKQWSDITIRPNEMPSALRSTRFKRIPLLHLHLSTQHTDMYLACSISPIYVAPPIATRCALHPSFMRAKVAKDGRDETVAEAGCASQLSA
jgi:hypothetical protein